MGLYENLPYSNFHEMNLDWIIESMVDTINKVSGLEIDSNSTWVLKDKAIFTTPGMFGAVTDGATDSSDAIQKAIDNSNWIVFEYGDYYINKEITIPSYKVIDFNNATIHFGENGKLFIGTYTNTGYNYIRNVVLKNGRFNSDYGINYIELVQAIFISIDNITIDRVHAGGCGIYSRNCFNIYLSNINIGSSGENQYEDSTTGILFYSEGAMSIPGTEANTNSRIENCLIQRCQYGINVNLSAASMDTLQIDNHGCSYCEYGINLKSSVSITNIWISAARFEFCTTAIYLAANSQLNIADLYTRRCDNGIVNYGFCSLGNYRNSHTSTGSTLLISNHNTFVLYGAIKQYSDRDTLYGYIKRNNAQTLINVGTKNIVDILSKYNGQMFSTYKTFDLHDFPTGDSWNGYECDIQFTSAVTITLRSGATKNVVNGSTIHLICSGSSWYVSY